MNRRERNDLAAIEAAWDAADRCQALISQRRRHGMPELFATIWLSR